MNAEDDLIERLDSTDPVQRNDAALKLRNLAESAVPSLFRAINRPDNKNDRGTLVYALMSLNCSGHFSELFSLAVHGNYEVQCHAVAILREQRFSVTEEEFQKAEALVDRANSGSETELLRDALKEILIRVKMDLDCE